MYSSKRNSELGNNEPGESSGPLVSGISRNFKIPVNWAQAPEFVPRNTPVNPAPTNPVPRSSAQRLIRATGNCDASQVKHCAKHAKRSPNKLTSERADTTSSLGYHARYRESDPESTEKSPLLPGPDLGPPKRKDFQTEDEFIIATCKYMEEELCPYSIIGECHYADGACILPHGNRCDMCNSFILNPNSRVQNERHRSECLKQLESEMEFAFAVAESADKRCGICLELVVEKDSVAERRFGVLPSCQHCFCLTCIRRWRKVRNFDNQTIRSCPECRVVSNFVIPSRTWMGSKEQKETMIQDYKIALSKKPCKYFNRVNRFCPFGSSCFYSHDVSATGTENSVGGSSPSSSERPLSPEPDVLWLRRLVVTVGIVNSFM